METINLEKGHKVDLSKEAPGLTKVAVGLGWDVNSNGGAEFDLDASAFLLNSTGKFTDSKNFVYFKNLQSGCGSVVHTGDNLTGQGEGDDEVVNVDLEKVPADIQEIMFVVNIFQAAQRRQNFGQVKNAFIRIFNPVTQEQILKYDLSEDQSNNTAMLMGRLYRHNGAWKFEASGIGEVLGLEAYLNRFQA